MKSAAGEWVTLRPVTDGKTYVSGGSGGRTFGGVVASKATIDFIQTVVSDVIHAGDEAQGWLLLQYSENFSAPIDGNAARFRFTFSDSTGATDVTPDVQVRPATGNDVFEGAPLVVDPEDSVHPLDYPLPEDWPVGCRSELVAQ